MREFSASGRERSRVNRCLLKLGTALGSGVLAAALLVPVAAQAADTSVRYQLATPVMQGTNAPVGFQAAAAGVTPQDLTVRPMQRLSAVISGGTATYSYGDITTTADNTPGVATNYSGNTTITAGNITTSGVASDGVHAYNPYLLGQTSQTSIKVGDVSTSGINSTGIYAANLNGGIAITAGNVTTTGAGAAGIYTRSVGDTTITAGDITTSGNASAGVSAVAAGQISINVGNVTSGGTGISAAAGGNINIAATSVTASGAGVPGILAVSGGAGTYYQAPTGGNVTIATGKVSSGGTGVYAHTYGAGAVQVTTGAVTATGTGIVAKSGSLGGRYYQPGSSTIYTTRSPIGGNVTVTTGNVTAIGAYVQGPNGPIFTSNADGVYARSYGAGAAVDVTVNGDIYAIGTIAHGVSAESGGTVNITTTGEIQSISTGVRGLHIPGAGIFAIADGDVTVNAEGRIKTYGPAIGIFGLSYHGDVTINASAINTYADRSAGIEAQTFNGKATVVAGDITMSGNQNTGILATGGGIVYSAATNSYVIQPGSVDVTLNGNIQATGQTNNGIVATAYGDVAIHNNGSITIGDIGGFGIRAAAYGTGNVVVDGQGSITTGKFNAGYGVFAVTQGGSISVTQGAIQSGRYGVLAIAHDTYGDNAANGININVASVSTTGTGQTGRGIVAVDYNGASTVTINAGSVTTIGDYANGITGQAFGTPTAGGTVTVTGGAISTRGRDANGVLLASDYENVTLNSVATTGLGAVGLDLQANPLAPNGGAINVNVGSISTTGDYALGVFAYHGTQSIQVGSITTAGKQSLGIYALSGGAITINAGSIATAGEQAIGILAESGTSVSITETGGITTQGDNASGIIAVAGSGSIDLTLTGAISTQGGRSFGVYGLTEYGAVNVQAGTITTAGGGAAALDVMALNGSATVNLSSASTTGDKSPAVMVKGETGVTLTANQITTSGDTSNALVIRSGGYGVIGNATVNVGSITTTGQHSAGIDAFTVGQSTGLSSTLSINVGSITTSGIDSVGISAFNTYGAININASNITTQGAEAVGMLLFGGNDINIQAGSISTGAADAIQAYGSGTITVGVSGKVASSGANGIVAFNTGGATNITVASGGAVMGAADAIQVQTGTGQVTVNNAGVITGGTGYAINVTGLPQTTPGASTQINNTGTIFGAVNLAAAGGNTLTNAGTFIATKDSFFGGGASQFVNTGVLQVGVGGAGTAGTVNFLNLATFENAGGLIDLRTAPVGEVLTLSGDYVASGDARLGLGVNANAADMLVIAGTATGATTILLGVNPLNATLLAKPLTLVQAGAGSTATFALSNPNVGLIHYGLQPGSGAALGPVSHDAAAGGAAGATVSYALTASAGAPVYGMLKLEESAQTIWRQSADAWSEHLAAMRGDAWGGGAAQGASSGYGLGSGRYWVQAYGSTSDRNQTVGTGYGNVSVDYNQTDAGVQGGADLARTATRLGTVGWGVTAGYTSSQIDALGGTLKSDVDTFNLGGYAVLNHGPYFANGLVKFDHHQISTSDSVAGYQANLTGNSYGAQFEVGRHFGSDRFAFEPTVSLTYVRTSLDNVSIDSQTLAFGDEDGVSGKIGGRFYANRTLAGTSFVFYAGAAAVDDFTGSQRATFYSGGTSQNVSADGAGAYAQAVAGVSARTLRDITLYLEGDANFGGDHSGAGVRLGARF